MSTGPREEALLHAVRVEHRAFLRRSLPSRHSAAACHALQATRVEYAAGTGDEMAEDLPRLVKPQEGCGPARFGDVGAWLGCGRGRGGDEAGPEEEEQ